MNAFNDKEWQELAELGHKIIIDLSANPNGDGVPGRNSRFEAISNMVKYLELHNYEVSK
jgi:hypothetical protein